jgi:predicted SAM-dependent methyltransferase
MLFQYPDTHIFSETLMIIKNIRRRLIAKKYIRGEGIEIGGLHRPLPVSPLAKVTYVDKYSTLELRKHHPWLHKKKFVDVSIVDDGEKLAMFCDATQDFVIANHFLEHCENPNCAIENMTRVLKKTGGIYIAIPDKHFSFDRHRTLTSYEHLIKDYKDGPSWSRIQHYEENVRLVEGIKNEDEIKKRTPFLLNTYADIHFHVWTQQTFKRFLDNLTILFPLKIELCVQNITEVICFLRKRL